MYKPISFTNEKRLLLTISFQQNFGCLILLNVFSSFRQITCRRCCRLVIMIRVNGRANKWQIVFTCQQSDIKKYINNINLICIWYTNYKTVLSTQQFYKKLEPRHVHDVLLLLCVNGDNIAKNRKTNFKTTDI